MGLAVVFLAIGFYYAYTKGATRRNQILVWTSAVIFGVAIGTPYAVALFASNDEEIPLVTEGREMREITVHVEGMT